MTDLFDVAEQEGVEVWYSGIPSSLSFSVPDNICLDLSLACGGAAERVHMAHELGHCAEGAFYNQYSKYDLIAKQERKADAWAIKKLVPKAELQKAFEKGCTEAWELAEYFSVTEDFIKKAAEYWKCVDY